MKNPLKQRCATCRFLRQGFTVHYETQIKAALICARYPDTRKKEHGHSFK
jgi:hypothetical protein